jgi:hypothetical protein
MRSLAEGPATPHKSLAPCCEAVYRYVAKDIVHREPRRNEKCRHGSEQPKTSGALLVRPPLWRNPASRPAHQAQPETDLRGPRFDFAGAHDL